MNNEECIIMVSAHITATNFPTDTKFLIAGACFLVEMGRKMKKI
jgi:hypothetical protein